MQVKTKNRSWSNILANQRTSEFSVRTSQRKTSNPWLLHVIGRDLGHSATHPALAFSGPCVSRLRYFCVFSFLYVYLLVYFLCKRFCVCLSSVSTVTRTSWDSYKLFGFNFWLVTRVGWAVTLWTKTICFSIPFGIFLFLLFVCLVAKTTKTRACFYQNLRILLFAKRPFVGLWIYQIGCRYEK